MKCLSYRQPWASLVVLGEKQVETRGSRFTGLLGTWHAVHASSTWTRVQRLLMDTGPFQARLAHHGITAGMMTHDTMPRGAIIGVAFVPDGGAARTEHVVPELDAAERAFGDYTPGRWAYQLANVFRLARPVLCTGRLGVFDLPAAVEHQVLLGLQGHPDLPAALTSDALLDEALAVAEQRAGQAAEVEALLARIAGGGARRDTRTPIERMVDDATGRS
jgi:hypothetical protein